MLLAHWDTGECTLDEGLDDSEPPWRKQLLEMHPRQLSDAAATPGGRAFVCVHDGEIGIHVSDQAGKGDR
ncbi:MAG: hypothetical protein M5U09_30225 [Gammaproteobacteria bacterium]|nr:hypothetical protein [Gammaproteobacteria bacterium]